MLKKDNLNKPVLDCDTRWNSIYLMLHSLFDLKHFCQMKAEDIPQLDIDNDDWELIESLVKKINWKYSLYYR